MAFLAMSDASKFVDGPVATYVAVAAAFCGGAYLLAKTKSLPSGCKPLSAAPSPSEGLLEVLSTLTAKDIHRRITAWTNQLGPVYTIQVLGNTILVVSDPAIIRQLISHGPDNLPKFHLAYAATNQVGSREKQDGLFTLSEATPYYHSIRKTCAPAFATNNLTNRFPKMRDISIKLVDKLSAVIPVDGSEVDIMPYMIAAFFDMSTNIGFDVDFKALDDPMGNKFLKSIRGGLREASARFTNPFRETLQSVFWWLPSSRQVYSDFEECYKVYESIIKELKSRKISPENNSIGACLMRVTNPFTGEGLSHKELMANVAPYLIGGFDTSTSSVTWALYNIARSPEVAQRLEKELMDAGLITKDGKPGRLPEWSDLTSLPYFIAVLKESMRLHSVAGSTATFRVTDKSMKIGDYWVAKGTPVWIPVGTIANSKYNFPSPEDFKPERWLEGPEQSHQDWTTMTFSGGARSCPGTTQGLAQVRTSLLLLLSRLHFKLGHSISDHDKMIENEVMSLTVVSGLGHPFIITPRA